MKLSPAIQSKSLDFLDIVFKDKLRSLILASDRIGIELRVAVTVRGPITQGKMWCRSRSVEEVRARKQLLEPLAPLIVESCMQDRWAEIGPSLTEHLPGESWHQWGEAADLFAIVGGRAVWDGSLVKPVADLAKDIGLYHSYNVMTWSPRKRHWHVQLRKEETPLLVRGYLDSWSELERKLYSRFEIVPKSPQNSVIQCLSDQTNESVV